MPNLRTVHESDFAECIDFLMAREHRCVTLMSNLAKDGIPVFPSATVRALVRVASSPGAAIDGILMVTASGILLHCFRENADQSRYAPLIARFLGHFSVRSAIGGHADTVFLESLISERPSRSVDYRLMTFCAGNAAQGDSPQVQSMPPGFSIIRCGPDDTDRLYPLQEGYEREEVMPPGEPVNREAIRKNLRASLGKQLIFMAMTDGKNESDGQTVAKAGTNARGLGWVQLGGVYTLPGWRGKGLARSLVRYIAENQTAQGKKVALFVKLTNESARKAYDKANFRPDILFRISYW